MIIFLYGQDTYRSRQKLKEIIEQYKKIHKSGLNLICLDGENLKFEDFRDTTRQTPMFAEKKLLILSNIFANQDFKEKFFKDSKDFLELKDTILFYEENEISGEDKFFNFLKSKTETQSFQPLGGEKLKNWARQEFSKLKTEISPEAVNRLINFVGDDLWRLSNEIKKLVNYRASPQRGEGGKENEVFFDCKKEGKGEEDRSSSSPFAATREINVEDIELLVKPKIETAIFKTIDAIAQKNKKQALSLIHQHLEKGDSPLYLLSMINFQFRNLLMIKDLVERRRPYYSILKTTRLHPFVVKKSCQQASKFTLPELKKIYQKIFQADLNIKTGRTGPEMALDLFLTEI